MGDFVCYNVLAMSAILRILIGVGICVVGYLLAAKTQWWLDILGPVAWAERTFASGGSRTFYKLLGTLIIVIGFIVITDLFDSIVGGLANMIF